MKLVSKLESRNKQTTVNNPIEKFSSPDGAHSSATIKCKRYSAPTLSILVLTSLLVELVALPLQPMSTKIADQDGALEAELDSSSGSSLQQRSASSSGDQEQQLPIGSGNKLKSLEEFLAGLPALNVGQKHTARFECELSAEAAHSAKHTKLVWLKLSRASNASVGQKRQQQHQEELANDIKLISLNEKMITPDKRFKVRRQSALKWTLTIDNVTADDNQAYYYCQTSSTANQTSKSVVSRFSGGAHLNVLMPPKIIERETSDSLVQVNEFERLVLRCKVVGEPQSQLMWKREDGKGVDASEQRYRHEISNQTNHIMSVDTSELVFNALSRNQSGAYLCIASNGVQPGVSQRVNVALLECRSSPVASASAEPCERPGANLDNQDDHPARWTPSVVDKQQQQRRQQRPPPDKRRTAPPKARPTNGGRPPEQVSIKQRAGHSSELDEQSAGSSSSAGSGSKQTSWSSYLLCYLAMATSALLLAR